MIPKLIYSSCLFTALICSGPNLASAAVISAASCTQSDVQKALSAAKSGDTVTVPGPCSTNWSGLNISGTTAITLNGGGNVTVSGSVNLNANASTPSRLTGFTFTSSGAVTTSGGSTSAMLRIDHNTFTGGGTMLNFCCNAPILFDHNTVTGTFSDEMIHNLGTGAGDYSVWTNDVTPGSPKMVYMEDNTFTGTSGYVNAVQNYYGAQIVFRHNTLNNAIFEAHGNTYYKTRWWEVYNNTFTNATQGMAGAIRGGSGVFFNNTCSGSNCDIAFREDNVSTYPACNQVGRGISVTPGGQPCANGTSTESLSPAYVWGNSPQSIACNQISSWLSCSGTQTVINVSRDVFVSASQPAQLSRCQSAADRTAGCPINYNYVPFTYPYPLDANGLPTQKSGFLLPPSNVRPTSL
jgi:hypothetical protein